MTRKAANTEAKIVEIEKKFKDTMKEEETNKEKEIKDLKEVLKEAETMVPQKIYDEALE